MVNQTKKHAREQLDKGSPNKNPLKTKRLSKDNKGRQTRGQTHRNSSNFGTTRSRGTAGYVGPSLANVNEAAPVDMNDDQPLTAKTLFQEAGQTLTQPGMDEGEDQPLTSGQKSPPTQDDDSDDDEMSAPEGTPTQHTNTTGMDEEEEDEEDDEEGQDLFGEMQTRRCPRRNFIARYDFKILIPPSEGQSTIPTMRSTIQSFWDSIKELDPTLTAYPWKEGAAMEDDDLYPDVTDFEESISEKSISNIQIYFDRAVPRKEGGTLYFSAHLAHDISFKTLHNDIKYWMEEDHIRGGWWYKPLQCEKAVCIGWLLYSTQEMDLALLTNELYKTLQVNVGLRYKTIAVKPRTTLTPAQMIKAVHVEIDSKFEETTKETIMLMYNSKRTQGWPLGIKMRLCPERKTISNPKNLTKTDLLRQKQATFLGNVRRIQTTDISVLDYPDPVLNGYSIRDLVMEIRSTTEPFHKLFISVDRHWRGEGVVFQATMKHSSEAESMVTGGMLPYFMAGINSAGHEALKKCFTVGAVKKASKAVWDEEQRCVISQEDNLLNMLFDCDIDDEYDDAGDDTEPLIIDLENLESGMAAKQVMNYSHAVMILS